MLRILKTTASTVLLVLALMLVLGCSRAPSTPTAGDGSAGSSSATTDEYRFAVMSPAIAIMLRDIGLEDSIVGKHAWDMVLSESVPIVGSEEGVDYESMIRAEPTHILFQRASAGVPTKLVEMSEQQGWIIMTIPLDSLDDIAIGVDDLYMSFVGVRDRAPGEMDPTARFEETEMPSESLARAWSDLGPIADRAGRVLVLGAVDPASAMGPGSFHFQLLERLGAESAITTGGMWQELDLEDIVRLNPDSIVLFSPRETSSADLFAPLDEHQTDIDAVFGRISTLDINAVRDNRLAIIDDPLGLIPSTSFGGIADRVAEILTEWSTRRSEP